MPERRQHPRVESLNLVSVGKFQESPVTVARSLILSEGGALLEMTKPYPIHTLFKLDLALGGELMTVQAEVRHVEVADDGSYHTGVQFIDLEPHTKERLETWVETRAEE